MTLLSDVRVLGIDPGVNGGAAIFCPRSIVKVPPRGIARIPTREIVLSVKNKHGAPKTRRVVDGAAFLGWVQYHQPTHAFVEQVWAMPTGRIDEETGERQDGGQQSMFNFGRAYGSILAVLECFGVDVVDVAPQRWQRWLGLHKLPKTVDKAEHSRQLAIQRTPCAEPFLRFKKDHNCAEGLLIAEYGAWCIERLGDDIEE